MYSDTDRIDRILKELEEEIFSESTAIQEIKIKDSDYGDYQGLYSSRQDWMSFEKGQRWGGKDTHAWFEISFDMPKFYEGKAVMLDVLTGTEDGWDALNPQFLVYRNEEVVQGFDVNHHQLLLTESATGGQHFEFSFFAYGGTEDQLAEFKVFLRTYHKEVETLYYDIKVPFDVAVLLSKEDSRRYDIFNYLTEAVNLVDFRKPHSTMYEDSIHIAIDYLKEHFYESYCHPSDVIETCIGHTHIDVAWLWTLAQTREKTARSFSTVLKLMEDYPSYQFMSSQPQLYEYLKEDHPDLYEKVKKRVSEGRWEAEGAMWLEADCNLVSGESLVRQVIYGKRFFKEEFGVESKVLWLPDVFGYSAALPQILRKSDVDYFMTTKISWNEYNCLPYDTFYWHGIDGTDILTYFVTTQDYQKNGTIETETTYNGDTTPLQVMGAWQRYQQKDLNKEILNCFGFGDGGGGVTRKMLENVKRLEKGIPGAPTVRIGKALEFFEGLENRIKDHPKTPSWYGELYLEYHRGTYTSMARNKRSNRQAEFDTLDTEWICSANQILGMDLDYPKEDLRKLWKTILLNQFHDIIPGSAIKEVYEVSAQDYEKVQNKNQELLQEGIQRISANVGLDKASIIVFNSLGFSRNDLVEVNFKKTIEAVRIWDEDQEIPVQKVGPERFVFFAKDIPAKGYKAFSYEESENMMAIEDFWTISPTRIESPYFNIRLNDKAEIISIYDKEIKREVLKDQERGNVLQAFEDKPHDFDAWDINIYYQDKMWEVSDVEAIEVVEEGPIRKGLYIRKKFLDSTIEQTIYVYRDLKRIDFVTDIDWKETQILLKTAFPVDINATKATYEIQYGHVERPTHWNTSWDYAKFEVCAHKWADFAEGNYGVALLNDCKYGHDIHNGVMRLSLIKSAKHPNVDADRERHHFTYSIYPHQGDFKSAKVIQEAYSLNKPLHVSVEDTHRGVLEKKLGLVQLDQENVFMDVFKQAEDSEATILRVYEGYNERRKVTCQLPQTIKSIVETNLLEREEMEILYQKNSFSFEIRPFEIKTFKIEFEKSVL